MLALLMQTNPGCLSRLASERLVRAWYRVTGCWRCRAVPLRDDFLPVLPSRFIIRTLVVQVNNVRSVRVAHVRTTLRHARRKQRMYVRILSDSAMTTPYLLVFFLPTMIDHEPCSLGAQVAKHSFLHLPLSHARALHSQLKADVKKQVGGEHSCTVSEE